MRSLLLGFSLLRFCCSFVSALPPSGAVRCSGMGTSFLIALGVLRGSGGSLLIGRTPAMRGPGVSSTAAADVPALSPAAPTSSAPCSGRGATSGDTCGTPGSGAAGGC